MGEVWFETPEAQQTCSQGEVWDVKIRATTSFRTSQTPTSPKPKTLQTLNPINPEPYKP